MSDHSELKRLALAAQNDNGDYVALNDYGMAVPPAVVLALIAEVETLRKDKSEPCDGCFMADAEAMHKGIDPKWALMDQSILIDHLRENTNFDADKFDKMVQFAVDSAIRMESKP